MCLRDWEMKLPHRAPLTGTQPWYPQYFLPGQQETFYGLTKFLQIQHAEYLAERELGSGPEVFSVCPGLVETKMGQAAEALCREQWINPPGVFRQHPCPYQPQVGAAVIAYAALQAPSESNGKWLVRWNECAEKAPFLSGFPGGDRSKLYERSLQWAGLKRENNETVSQKFSVLV